MSDPAFTPKQLTEAEFQTIVGRLAALEVSLIQVLVFAFKCVPDAERDDLRREMEISIEAGFPLLHPVAQRTAAESLDGMLSLAVTAVRKAEG
jgi:hypothetical protein